jgi:hypothetical protein
MTLSPTVIRAKITDSKNMMTMQAMPLESDTHLL